MDGWPHRQGVAAGCRVTHCAGCPVVDLEDLTQRVQELRRCAETINETKPRRSEPSPVLRLRDFEAGGPSAGGGLSWAAGGCMAVLVYERPADALDAAHARALDEEAHLRNAAASDASALSAWTPFASGADPQEDDPSLSTPDGVGSLRTSSESGAAGAAGATEGAAGYDASGAELRTAAEAGELGMVRAILDAGVPVRCCSS